MLNRVSCVRMHQEAEKVIYNVGMEGFLRLHWIVIKSSDFSESAILSKPEFSAAAYNFLRP
jgi:hypothetical protein